MITFYEACKIASDFFKEMNGREKLMDDTCETKDAWVFSADYGQEPVFGPQPISVKKADGTVKPFYMTDEANLKILKKAKYVETPEEFLHRPE